MYCLECAVDTGFCFSNERTPKDNNFRKNYFSENVFKFISEYKRF